MASDLMCLLVQKMRGWSRGGRVVSLTAAAESMLRCGREKGQQSAIDMFNKLAPMTAGVIVSAALGSARHMVANRHDIAACPDLSIPSQWH